MFVCTLAVALALVGAGGRLSFCLALRLSVCVMCYGKRDADALALLGVHIAAVDVSHKACSLFQRRHFANSGRVAAHSADFVIMDGVRTLAGVVDMFANNHIFICHNKIVLSAVALDGLFLFFLTLIRII